MTLNSAMIERGICSSSEVHRRDECAVPASTGEPDGDRRLGQRRNQLRGAGGARESELRAGGGGGGGGSGAGRLRAITRSRHRRTGGEGDPWRGRRRRERGGVVEGGQL